MCWTRITHCCFGDRCSLETALLDHCAPCPPESGEALKKVRLSITKWTTASRIQGQWSWNIIHLEFFTSSKYLKHIYLPITPCTIYTIPFISSYNLYNPTYNPIQNSIYNPICNSIAGQLWVGVLRKQSLFAGFVPRCWTLKAQWQRLKWEPKIQVEQSSPASKGCLRHHGEAWTLPWRCGFSQQIQTWVHIWLHWWVQTWIQTWIRLWVQTWVLSAFATIEFGVETSTMLMTTVSRNVFSISGRWEFAKALGTIETNCSTHARYPPQTFCKASWARVGGNQGEETLGLKNFVGR